MNQNKTIEKNTLDGLTGGWVRLFLRNYLVQICFNGVDSYSTKVTLCRFKMHSVNLLWWFYHSQL